MDRGGFGRTKKGGVGLEDCEGLSPRTHEQRHIERDGKYWCAEWAVTNVLLLGNSVCISD